MNERINNLIDQSGFGSYAEIPDTYVVHKNDLAEFAELIVQECEKVAKGGSWYYDAPSCGWRNPINFVCNEMKEHFGVKE